MEKWKLRFFSIWAGQTASSFGTDVAQFALVWWITKLTGSAMVLATATAAALVPTILLSPFAGVYVDRHSRRLIMIVSDAFIALVSLWLAYLFWTDTMQIGHVYVVVIARALGSAFYRPASGASVTLLVPKEHYGRISGMDQTRSGVLTVAGPLLGALAIAWFPLHHVMLFDFGTAAFAIAPLLFFTIPQPAVEPSAARASFWQDFVSGLQYVVQWRALMLLVSLVAVANVMLFSSMSLMPLLVFKGFGGEARMLGWFQSASGFGMIAGGLALGIWGGPRRKIPAFLACVTGVGAALLFPAWAPTSLWPIAVGSLGLLGVMFSIAQGNFTAATRGLVDPVKQGRFYALLGSLLQSLEPPGILVAGAVADVAGIRAWFAICGVVLVLTGGIGFLSSPLRRIEQEAGEVQVANRAQ
ncbi:MFS transporter [Candidatus Bipolaricaulota bacterium]|nr:MFS transporter [Candidatus Bipolaricaulota bacterium]